jgi:hypothetical protein
MYQSAMAAFWLSYLRLVPDSLFWSASALEVR